MTRPALPAPPPPVTFRTRTQVRAEALTLDGRASLVARAETDAPAPPTPEDQGTVGEIWLYGVVGGWWWGFDAESVANAIRGMDVDTLYVRIHSPGGIASEGIAIANLLRNLSAKVVVLVDGMAASAASVIAIAGDEVIMCPGSQLMLHDASTGFCVWGTAEELREQVDEVAKIADWIDGVSQNYAGVYAYRAGGTAPEWRQVMTANGALGTWYTADEAVAARLADSVGTRPAVGSPPVAPSEEFDDEFDDEDSVAKVAHDLQVLDQCVHPAARAAWHGERPKSPTASAGGSTHTEGGSAVAFSDEQITTMRQQLGLPESADEATILAALDEALEERAEAPAAPTTEIPAGTALVDASVLEELRAGAAAGREASTTLANQERDRAINQALAEGRIAATSRDSFLAAWDANPAATRAVLDTLTPGLVPTSESGHGDQPEVTAEDELYNSVWGAEPEKKGA